MTGDHRRRRGWLCVGGGSALVQRWEMDEEMEMKNGDEESLPLWPPYRGSFN